MCGYGSRWGSNVDLDEDGGKDRIGDLCFVDTAARRIADDTLAIDTEHKLDPRVISAGVACRS